MVISPPQMMDPSDYLARPAEKLVLEGCRYWIRGTVLQSIEPWTSAQFLYRQVLGDVDGAEAIVALARFTRSLGKSAIQPLSVFKAGCPYVCRDETLVLGLIAGFQNVDERAIHACIGSLCCPRQFDQVAMAAGVFALTLKHMDQVLMPIPARVIERIASRYETSPSGAPLSETIH